MQSLKQKQNKQMNRIKVIFCQSNYSVGRTGLAESAV